MQGDCLIIIYFDKFDKTVQEIQSIIYEGVETSESYFIYCILEKRKFEEKTNQDLLIPLAESLYKNLLLLGFDSKLSLNEFRHSLGQKINTFKCSQYQEIILSCLKKDFALASCEVLALAFYDFDQYKTQKEEAKEKKITLINENISDEEIQKISIQCDCANWARDLVNTPAKDLTPSDLATISNDLADQFNLKIQIFGQKDIEKLGMGALQAVSYGSSQEAKFIILQYQPKTAKKHIALVGKGITFDSGGLSLKPSNFMIPMKTDMAGAATVLGAFRSLVALKTNIQISCVIPTSENMIDGDSIKLGDVVTAYNGKTIEIHNSDAEGRLALADALAYTEDKLKPDMIVDVATLTGAVKVCLGNEFAGLMTNDDKLCKELIESGKQTNEPLWQLPLTQYHKDLMKGKLADLCNIASKPVAGTSCAGAFLKNFVEKTPWAHLDIAGVARECQTAYLSHHGATGFGVRLLSQWALNIA